MPVSNRAQLPALQTSPHSPDVPGIDCSHENPLPQGFPDRSKPSFHERSRSSLEQEGGVPACLDGLYRSYKPPLSLTPHGNPGSGRSCSVTESHLHLATHMGDPRLAQHWICLGPNLSVSSKFLITAQSPVLASEGPCGQEGEGVGGGRDRPGGPTWL